MRRMRTALHNIRKVINGMGKVDIPYGTASASSVHEIGGVVNKGAMGSMRIRLNGTKVNPRKSGLKKMPQRRAELTILTHKGKNTRDSKKLAPSQQQGTDEKSRNIERFFDGRHAWGRGRNTE